MTPTGVPVIPRYPLSPPPGVPVTPCPVCGVPKGRSPSPGTQSSPNSNVSGKSEGSPLSWGISTWGFALSQRNGLKTRDFCWFCLFGVVLFWFWLRVFLFVWVFVYGWFFLLCCFVLFCNLFEGKKLIKRASWCWSPTGKTAAFTGENQSKTRKNKVE